MTKTKTHGPRIMPRWGRPPKTMRRATARHQMGQGRETADNGLKKENAPEVRIAHRHNFTHRPRQGLEPKSQGKIVQEKYEEKGKEREAGAPRGKEEKVRESAPLELLPPTKIVVKAF